MKIENSCTVWCGEPRDTAGVKLAAMNCSHKSFLIQGTFNLQFSGNMI